MSGNPLAQVQIPSQDKKYSCWSTVIRSAFYVLVYGKHYFASRNQNFQYKGGVFFCGNLMTTTTEEQDSFGASEVSVLRATNLK